MTCAHIDIYIKFWRPGAGSLYFICVSEIAQRTAEFCLGTGSLDSERLYNMRDEIYKEYVQRTNR